MALLAIEIIMVKRGWGIGNPLVSLILTVCFSLSDNPLGMVLIYGRKGDVAWSISFATNKNIRRYSMGNWLKGPRHGTLWWTRQVWVDRCEWQDGNVILRSKQTAMFHPGVIGCPISPATGPFVQNLMRLVAAKLPKLCITVLDTRDPPVVPYREGQ